MKYHYHANRGGHAPGHLRGAFAEWAEEGLRGAPRIDEDPIDTRWLIGQLWNCTDVMPSGLCGDLDLNAGSSYAQGVRSLR